MKQKKHSIFRLFYLVATACVLTGIFAPLWTLLLFFAVLSLTTGLIYEAYAKKGLEVRTIFVLVHLLMVVGAILVTYDSTWRWTQIVLQYLRKETPDLRGISSFKIPLFLDLLLFLGSVTIFLVGLFEAKSNPATIVEDKSEVLDGHI